MTDWSKIARGVVRKVEKDNPDPKVRDLAKTVGESMDAQKVAPALPGYSADARGMVRRPTKADAAACSCDDVDCWACGPRKRGEM